LSIRVFLAGSIAKGLVGRCSDKAAGFFDLIVTMKAALSRPYEVAFHKRHGYVYARVTATELSGQVVYDFLSDILAEAANIRFRRILIDRDIAEPPPDNGEALRAWNHFLSLVTGHRIAIFNRHPAIHDQLCRRLCLIDKSPSAIRIFDQMPAARAWLTRGPIPPHVAVPRAFHA
jgi:hypothetical protein